MTLATTGVASTRPDNVTHFHYTGTVQSDWVTVCTAPDAVEADDNVVSGGKVVRPGAIVRAAQAKFQPCGKGSEILIALRYNDDVGTPTSPVVRVFGKDHNGIWHAMLDAEGTAELTLTVTTATDVISEDGYKLTAPVRIPLDASEEVLVAVQTAFAASSGTVTDSTIVIKLA